MAKKLTREQAHALSEDIIARTLRLSALSEEDAAREKAELTKLMAAAHGHAKAAGKNGLIALRESD